MSERTVNLKNIQIVTADMLDFDSDYLLCFNEQDGEQSKISLRSLENQMTPSFINFPQQTRLAEQSFAIDNHEYFITIDLNNRNLDSSIREAKNISSANLLFIYFAETQNAKNVYFDFSYYTKNPADGGSDSYRTIVDMFQVIRTYETVEGGPVFLREGREFNIPVIDNKIYLSCKSNIIGSKVEIGLNSFFVGYID